jgi:hypothetical protein
MTAYPPSNRRIVIDELPAEWSRNYQEEEYLENLRREESIRKHPAHVILWLFAWNLFVTAFIRDDTIFFSYAPPQSPAQKGAIPLRIQLLMLSARASKPALDLTLSCHYSEAWALLRSMLEGWARAVYVRVQPDEYIRWYRLESDDPEAPLPLEPNWSPVTQAIRDHGDDNDRAMVEAAQPIWSLLNLGAHPSGEGITQVLGDRRGNLSITPSYHEEFCLHTFSHSMFIQRALLREIERLDFQPQMWLDLYDRFVRNAEPVIASSQEALEVHKARLAKRRAARRKP